MQIPLLFLVPTLPNIQAVEGHGDHLCSHQSTPPRGYMDDTKCSLPYTCRTNITHSRPVHRRILVLVDFFHGLRDPPGVLIERAAHSRFSLTLSAECRPDSRFSPMLHLSSLEESSGKEDFSDSFALSSLLFARLLLPCYTLYMYRTEYIPSRSCLFSGSNDDNLHQYRLYI